MSRRIREGWLTAVAEYRRSGVTQRAFAARCGVSVTTLRRWLDRSGTTARRPNDRPSILPVRVVASTAPLARWQSDEVVAVEVLLPGGVQLALRAGADVEYVARLVRALSSSPC